LGRLLKPSMTVPPPLISVVVPIYNSGRFLRATLDSVAAQTEGRWECVVVDDGSVDDGPAIAGSFADADPRFRVETQENRGPSAARNAGFCASHRASRYVTFMDSDDVWLPHALGTLLERLERRLGPSVVMGWPSSSMPTAGSSTREAIPAEGDNGWGVLVGG
jgi:glycosyltransferase involved in cell wall biosynthesis